jgi:hypothetical protein
MVQPSIHKRDVGIEPHGCVRALFDMRDLSQMLAHVHDAAMEVGEGPENRQRSEGAPMQ